MIRTFLALKDGQIVIMEEPMTQEHHQETMRKTKARFDEPDGDDEIRAMNYLVLLLKPFDEDARKRMIKYCMDRLKRQDDADEPVEDDPNVDDSGELP